MFDFDQLRERQEQRLLLVLDSWNEAKEHLKQAIARAEKKEREYREISDDVRRRLDALDLVNGMMRELGEIPGDRSLNASGNQPLLTPPAENGAAALKAMEKASTPIPLHNGTPTPLQNGPPAPLQNGPAPLQNGPPEPPAFDGISPITSRPLFPTHVRSRYARLSILQ